MSSYCFVFFGHAVQFVSIFFLLALIANAVLALICSDCRLKIIAAWFLIVWLATQLTPITVTYFAELIISPISFIFLTRVQLRRPNERKLAWWMIIVIFAELLILVSPILLLSSSPQLYWWSIDILFAVQISTTTITGFTLAISQNVVETKTRNLKLSV